MAVSLVLAKRLKEAVTEVIQTQDIFSPCRQDDGFGGNWVLVSC